MTDEEKIEVARREGERAGADRYLGEVVAARLERATGRSADQVKTLLAHVASASFTNEEGDVDGGKIEAFAASLGTVSAAAPHDPVAAALSRQRPAGGGEKGSALQDKREQTRDKLTKKGNR
jgi:hypothetical protein